MGKKLIKNTLFSLGVISVLTASQAANSMGKTNNFQAKTNNFWWPEQLNLSSLRDHDNRSNPYLAGNVVLENMGFKTYGFAGVREK